MPLTLNVDTESVTERTLKIQVRNEAPVNIFVNCDSQAVTLMPRRCSPRPTETSERGGVLAWYRVPGSNEYECVLRHTVSPSIVTVLVVDADRGQSETKRITL